MLARDCTWAMRIKDLRAFNCTGLPSNEKFVEAPSSALISPFALRHTDQKIGRYVGGLILLRG